MAQRLSTYETPHSALTLAITKLTEIRDRFVPTGDLCSDDANDLDVLHGMAARVSEVMDALFLTIERESYSADDESEACETRVSDATAHFLSRLDRRADNIRSDAAQSSRRYFSAAREWGTL